MGKRVTLIQKREERLVSDLVERLRESRLMNPDYPTRLEAANEIERLRTYLRSCRIYLNDGYSREAVIREINICLEGKSCE